ncbi:MAG TPA: hypothetical protein VFA28_06790 [Bryobacteraceae bacterium]|jgi:hypothetical protein|nr:hypothetical protein [Bryobacteraceae bacterium]
MIKIAALLLAGFSAFAVTIPRRAGEVAIAVPGKGQELLSNYRGKVVVLAFILVT